MKKILMVTDNLPDQINGVNTTYQNIEPYAIRDGYTIHTISPRDFRYFDCPIYNEVKLAFPREMGQKIEEISPDHIHIATEGPVGLCARKYLSKHRIGYTTAYHTRFPEGLRKLFGIPENITWPLIRWFHKNSNLIFTTTDTMVSELKNKGFNRVISWTRGVDRDIFYPIDKPKNDPIVLLCVSRVSKEKNLEDFFNLKYPNSVKIMVGDGPMRQYYEKMYPEVRFVGYKTGKELAKYYQEADVFVFPSRWETFGIVMIEAMACGIPVAAYRCSGPQDVIEEGVTGYMEEDLYSSIKKCLELDKKTVFEGSKKWSWENAWKIFKTNLV